MSWAVVVSGKRGGRTRERSVPAGVSNSAASAGASPVSTPIRCAVPGRKSEPVFRARVRHRVASPSKKL
ncbi:hypothetical protein WT60_13190 [Burkholderia sp. MSMB617WGS]|nr:hypothetical protein WT60_13190 [Burkholderia sp. MSMB617WGS]